MEIEPLEVYASDSNYAVIKLPGRQYPGCVIQGDSLAILCRMSKHLVEFARATKIDDEDVLENIQELNNALVGRLLHYQNVLGVHDVDLPHVHAFTEADLVQLVPDNDDPTK